MDDLIQTGANLIAILLGLVGVVGSGLLYLGSHALHYRRRRPDPGRTGQEHYDDVFGGRGAGPVGIRRR